MSIVGSVVFYFVFMFIYCSSSFFTPEAYDLISYTITTHKQLPHRLPPHTVAFTTTATNVSNNATATITNQQRPLIHKFLLTKAYIERLMPLPSFWLTVGVVPLIAILPDLAFRGGKALISLFLTFCVRSIWGRALVGRALIVDRSHVPSF